MAIDDQGALSLRAHPVAHRPEPVDFDLDHVPVAQEPSLRRADARGRARGDDVAGQQRHRAREPCHDLGRAEHEVGGRALLHELAVDAGAQAQREQVLDLLKELVNLSLPNLHLCATSRWEIDIRNVLEPLTSHRVSLHDQSGQKKDIVAYVKSVLTSDPMLQRYRDEDKRLVIETLSERANGM